MAIGFPAYHQVKIKHGLEKDQCVKKIEKALEQLPWKEIGYIKEAFDYRTEGTMLTMAERILIYVGNTEILVKSYCLFPAQFLDFGKNKRNVEDFFELYHKA